MKIISLGAHILDVLARPVDTIPPGQGSALVEQIKVTAAGTAGGTAVTLAKLGAEVFSAGAVGPDAAGRMLRMLLEDHGISTAHLRVLADLQTSMSVLPIRPNGERPALHVVGATAAYPVEELPAELFAEVTYLHLGGPEFFGGAVSASVLSRARRHGVVTSADLLAPGNPGLLDWIAEALPHLDYLLPNDEQVLGLTGAATLLDGCRALVDRGVGCVAATAGAEGALVVTRDGHTAVPAFEVSVVDTTGCGDAFSAGFLRAVALGRSPDVAARLGCAVAGLVAGGLGSDYGDFDFASADKFARSAVTR
ncbi:PfkB family carbohydrate kinase [Nocardia sp. NPDC050710]|uniref:carbohydrate kinase family protein n=1 Tax=Nocardia sp. NPDC050710 TaxID=3157220 RepID=UPI0033C520D6